MNTTKNAWSIKEHSRNVHRVTFGDLSRNSERLIFVSTDHHVDNAHCRRDILSRHLTEAKDADAPIFMIGDTFCAMQGKWDKRADQHQLRDDLRGNNYLDLLKRTVGEYYAPYAQNIALVTPGNHEGAIAHRHQTNLTECLVNRLQMEDGSRTHLGAYTGFVIFSMERAGKSYAAIMHYHHGYGGGGEVTRGLIDNNRTRGQYEADIYVSGHIHRRNVEENVIQRVTNKGAIQQRTQLFLRCSTYKDESQCEWHVSGGRASRPIGGFWVKIKLTSDDKIELTPIPAN